MRHRLLSDQPELHRYTFPGVNVGALSWAKARHQAVGGVIAILLTGAAGWILGLQGWRSQPPAFDMLTYFNNAAALIQRGTLPRVGDVSSYGSFSPPGTSWFMALGMLVFNDPRLYEKAGSGLLYLGTLLGVFLLARTVFGHRCAYLSVLLYGLSGLGFSIAGSLWPIGHPFFYVWMGYLTVQWVKRRDARYLAATLLVWVVGMNVDMAITPAVLALPAVWLIYHRPLLSRSILAAAVLGLAVWFPYLQFEAGRGFIDLRSQLLRESVAPADYRATWCDPALSLQTVAGPVASPTTPSGGSVGQSQEAGMMPAGLGRRLVQRARVAGEGLLTNFNGAVPTPLARVALLLLTLATLAVIGLRALAPYADAFVARTSPRSTWYAKLNDRLGALAATHRPTRELLESQVVFLLLLAIPWLLLLAVAEPGRPERFYWLWPLQVIALAAFVTNVLPLARISRMAIWVACLAVVVMLLWGPVSSRLGPTLHGQWAGTDPDTVRAMSYVASDLRSQGTDRAAVGYQVYIYQFMAAYNAIDPHYKAGADLDLILRFQHGIVNTDTCAEGFSPGDQYRIVQTRPDSDPAAPRDYINVSPGNDYHLLGRAGAYEVFKRN